MKIKKLNESKKLVEDEEVKLDSEGKAETTLSDVNPQDASKEEIAAALQGSAAENSDGEKTISDEDALAQAAEIKKDAKEIGAGFVELAPTEDDYNSVFGQNRLTQLLDDALETSRKTMRRNWKTNSNVLIEGLPGSGKTAIVEAWAHHHSLVLAQINVTDSKLETSINGVPVRTYKIDKDKEQEEDDIPELRMARTDLFAKTLANPENEGKCVLFVDELNRQKDDQIRRPLMSLFNEKRNADGTLNFSKTLLFTICCINPVGQLYQDEGVANLNDAEINRFFHQWFGDKGYDSNKDDSKAYIDAWFEEEMLRIGVNVNKNNAYGKRTGIFGPWKKKFTPQELEDIDDTLKVHSIFRHIVDNNSFKYDTRADLDDIHDQRKQLLSARELTALVFNCVGDKDKILRVLDNSANLLERDINMLKKILDSYVLDIDALRRSVNLFVDADGNVLEAEPEKKSDAQADQGGNNSNPKDDDVEDDSEDDEGDEEADDKLFSQQTNRSAATAGDAVSRTKKAVSDW